MEPLVSIVIPVYNRDRIVNVSIESALSQTYTNIEIIIIDNNSTDNTWKELNHYALKYEQIRIFRNEKNVGPVQNWINGIAKSKGIFVKILFSDDWIEPNDISANVKYLMYDENIGLVFNPIKIYFKDKVLLFNKKFKNTKVMSSSYFLSQILLHNNMPVSPCCAMFRRNDLIENLMLYVPNKKGVDFSKLGAGNDLLLFMLTAINYPKIIYNDEVFVNFLAHEKSLTVENNLTYFYKTARMFFINKYYKNYQYYYFHTLILLNIPRVFAFLNLIRSKKVKND